MKSLYRSGLLPIVLAGVVVFLLVLWAVVLNTVQIDYHGNPFVLEDWSHSSKKAGKWPVLKSIPHDQSDGDVDGIGVGIAACDTARQGER